MGIIAGAMGVGCLLTGLAVRLFFYEPLIWLLANLSRELGYTRFAFGLLRRQLHRNRRRRGDRHRDTALTRCLLGQMLYENGAREEGRAHVQEAAEFLAAYPLEQERFFRLHLEMLAQAQSAIEQHDACLETMQRLARAWHQRHGEAKPMPALCSLGIAFLKAGRPEQAVLVLEQAIATGKTNPLETGTTRGVLGEALVCLGRYAEAERLFTQACEILEPEQSHFVADTLDSYALLREKQENWPDAERLRRQAVKAFQTHLGEKNYLVADQLEKLAQTLRQQDRATESDLCQQRAQRIRKELLCQLS
jgi:tetratricopeptide (TPR) repeat protein